MGPRFRGDDNRRRQDDNGGLAGGDRAIDLIHKMYIILIYILGMTMPIQIMISKWGNSLGLRVPKDIAARVGLTEGARVDIETSADGRIIVTRSRRRFTLDELLAEMTPEREPGLEDDDPRGEELI